ncbi:MAG: hypothetical protein GOU98_01070 [Candidatus Altiarchaeota archaeon]|nr:hypothetical protein [Candidatus Altiarchaeota archaeon]
MNGSFDMKLFVIVLVLVGALTATVTSAADIGLPEVNTQDVAPLQQLPQPQAAPQGFNIPQGSANCG